jgi:hypothetical protein
MSSREKAEIFLECPNCGADYNPNDYRADAQEWLCSECFKPVPRFSSETTSEDQDIIYAKPKTKEMHSFQGTGTSFVGKRDFRPNESYVTTEFYTLMGIPIAPIRSYRVMEGDTTKKDFSTYIHHYTILDETKLNAKQVFCVYAYMAFILFAVCLFFTIMFNFVENISSEVFLLILLGLCLIVGFIPYWLRQSAKKHPDKISQKTNKYINGINEYIKRKARF